MKIKKSDLEQIIKEEVLKVKKIQALKEQKAKIVKQLNELYEEDECQMEGELLEASGVSKEEAEKIINSHKTKKEFFQKMKPEFKEKFIQFIMKNPEVQYFGWNKEKAAFEDRANYTFKKHEFGSGSEE